MQKEDIDKLQRSIEDGIKVYRDIDEELEKDGNVSLLEGSLLVLKHGGKAVRFATALREMGREIADLDGEKALKIANLLTEGFGGSDEAREAVSEIAEGTGKMNSGIQKLIALKKN